MAGQRLVVELFYDVVSPYTYIGFEALCRYRQPWDMELRLKPIFLAALMREAGNQSPALVSIGETPHESRTGALY